MTTQQMRVIAELESTVGIHERWTWNHTLCVTTCTLCDYRIAPDGTISEIDWSRDR